MKRVFLIFLFTALLCSQSQAQEERRFQVWNKNSVILHPWKIVELELTQKFHYSPKNQGMDLRYSEMFIGYKQKNWLKYGLGYRISQANAYPGWIQENRSMLYIDLIKNTTAIQAKFTSRFEYRDYNSASNHFRYRQALALQSARFTPLHLRIFMIEESFHKLNGVGTHLARLHSGISTSVEHHFQIKLYYILEKYKLTEWNTTDIAGINFSYVL